MTGSQHRREQTGSPPSPQQIEDWIAALTESRFNELRLTSFAFFEEAADSYMQEQIEAAKGEAVDQSILGEVRRLNQELSAKVEAVTSTGTAWKIGIGAGVLASLLFTLLVSLGNWIFTSDPSPFALMKTLTNHGAAPAPTPAPTAPAALPPPPTSTPAPTGLAK